jgi:S-adenosyl-L-methionine hydrolase (adenosine-forming)
MGAVVTLTTDFGLRDAYAAIVKGVILHINPEAVIVDISHHIPPQDIKQAAFILNTSYTYFPYQTVHLVVVDPGVGTNRLPVILKTPDAYFVAPDNGVLSYILEKYDSQPTPDSRQVKIGPQLKAYFITNSDYWLKPVSQTFHGRDIFAPVAARLSLGTPPSGLGEKIDTLTVFPVPHPFRRGEELIGHIVHIDSFGNLITDIKAEMLPIGGQSINIVVGDYVIQGLTRNYLDKEGLQALIGSMGYLEISLQNNNASAFLKARAGDEINVTVGK